MDWYYMVGDSKQGPFSEDEMRELMALGVVDGGTLVWSPDLPGWTAAGKVPSLRGEGPGAGAARTAPDGSSPERVDAEPHPWLRYFARGIDIWIFSFLWGFVAALLLGATSPGLGDAFAGMDVWILWLVTLAALVPIEALFLSSLGTTPGKWLFGLRVQRPGGEKPAFEGALQRSALVWWRGLALGIPIVSLFTLVHAKDVVGTAGTATWDRDTEHEVWHQSTTGPRIVAWLLLITLFTVAILYG